MIQAQTKKRADPRTRNSGKAPAASIPVRVAGGPVHLSDLHRALLNPSQRAATPALLARAGVEDLVTLAHEPMFSAWLPQIAGELLSRENTGRVITGMLTEPRLRPAVLAALRGEAQPPVAELLAGFDANRMETRFAAARALGLVCNEPTVEQLIGMTGNPAHHREALAALLDCRLTSAQTFIVHYREASNLRTAEIQSIQREYAAVE